MDAMTTPFRDAVCPPARTVSATADTVSLAAAIQGLQRVVVSLHYAEGLRLPEIAVVLELSELEVAHLFAQALSSLGAAPAAHRHAA